MLMANRMTKKEKDFIRSSRLAHLATADDTGSPSVVPICFAFDGHDFFSPIDEKPKKTSPLSLKRVRNIRANPRVALVVDRYDENWKRLAHVLIWGKGHVLLKGPRHRRAALLLRKKYPQYLKMAIHERPIIRIVPTRLKSWGAL